MALFKAYDIRGIVPDELDAEKAYGIGRAVAAFIGDGPIVVGRDARVHSVELTDALVNGIRDEGLDVRNFAGSVMAWARAGGGFVDPDGAPTHRVHTWSGDFDWLPVGYEGVTGDVVWNPETQTGYMRLTGMPANDPAVAGVSIRPDRSTHSVPRTQMHSSAWAPGHRQGI